jgi:hypothetical protein
LKANCCEVELLSAEEADIEMAVTLRLKEDQTTRISPR